MFGHQYGITSIDLLFCGLKAMDTQPPTTGEAQALHPPVKLSKNQQKKLKRDQEWEANRELRKLKRREKIQEKKQSKRAAREQIAPADSVNTGPDQIIAQFGESSDRNKRARHRYTQLPITLLIDCGFDDLMIDKELKSLSSQITRCYSDNHKAPFQAHLALSSFGGHLRERYDGILAGTHRSWRNVRFLEDDFVKGAEQATEWMSGPEGGNLAGVFDRDREPQQKPEESQRLGETVYLTSDSPDTLTELRPYSTYVVGGLVDKNRHKGICYKTAMDRGMKTAKLPIGDYMKMNSRFVLATNHVVEIMLRWLEIGDWGKAFDMVIPKRKGATLKNQSREADMKADEDASDHCIDPVEEDSTNHMKGLDEPQKAIDSNEEGSATLSPITMVPNGSSGADIENNISHDEADLEASGNCNVIVNSADADAETVLSSTRAEVEDSDTEESYMPLTGTKSEGKKRMAELMKIGEGLGPSKRAKGTTKASSSSPLC